MSKTGPCPHAGGRGGIVNVVYTRLYEPAASAAHRNTYTIYYQFIMLIAPDVRRGDDC